MTPTTRFFSTCEVKSASDHCCPSTKETNWYKTVENVCRVAIAVFCLYINPFLSAAFLAIGALAGAAYKAYLIQFDSDGLQEATRKPVCAQGFMEMLSGLKFSPVANLIATAAFITAHIRHDPIFFVPFSSLFVGSWAGRVLAEKSYEHLKEINGFAAAT